MRKLTQAEKEALKAKIADERADKHQKEQKLIAYKRQCKKYGGAKSGARGFAMINTNCRFKSTYLSESDRRFNGFSLVHERENATR